MVIGRPSKLYDRCQEQHLLEEAYKHRTFCLISGEPGTGKTSLALSLRDRVRQDGGYFVCGKFNQSQSRSPYPSMVSAFTEFAQQVEERGHVDEMRRRIHATIQSEGSVLTDIIPALKNLVGDQQHTALPGEKAVLRFVFVFRAFLLAVASPEVPIVICVDDVQWADACSLQLLASLIPSTSDRGVFFVATSRNDVGHDSFLSSVLRDLEREKVHICHISLTNMPPEVVAEMLVDMLSLNPQDADSLSVFLQSRTDGNILFLLELLRRLQDEGLLTESERSSWDFSGGALNREIVSLRHLLIEKMRELPPPVQEVLKLAAFLQGGSNVDEDLLCRLSSTPVKESLEVATERQFFVFECDTYRWVHDEIEAAAYALVNPDQVQETHLAIGRQLWKSMDEEELKRNIFVVLNQLMHGVDLIQTQDERNAVASLCLWAGETAARSSTFRTARVYLDLGILLLGEDQWRDQYELSIALHNLTAECAYCAGGTSYCTENQLVCLFLKQLIEFDHAKYLREQVFHHGKSLQDMIRLHILHVCDLGARDKLLEAKEYCMGVLRELGETFPRNPTKVHVLLALLKTRKKIRGMSDEALLRLANMSNVDKLAVMQILNVMFLNVYFTDPLLTPLVAVRMVSLSLDYGLSSISSAGFAFYGVLSCKCGGDTEFGYRCGQLALQLLEKFKCAEFVPRVYAAVYGFINSWKYEFSPALEPLMYAHSVGLETGDIEFAMVNASIFGYMAFNAGKSLVYCERQIASFVEALESRNRDSSLATLRSLQQLILNLMGKDGDQVKEECTTQSFTNVHEKRMSMWSNYHTAFLRYLLGDFEGAAEEIIKTRPLSWRMFSNVESSFVVMLDGLIHLSPGRHRSVSTARRCVRELKRETQKAPHQLLHCLYLLQAELAAFAGRSNRAIIKFVSAAAIATESQFRADLGITLERFGDFYGRLGQEAVSRKYYLKSLDTFREWGAAAKVSKMRDQHPRLT